MFRRLEFRDLLVALAAVPLLVVAVVAAGLILFVDAPGTTPYGLFALFGLLAAVAWVSVVGSAAVGSIEELTASTAALADAQAAIAGGESTADDVPLVESPATGHLARLADSINAVGSAAAEAAEGQRGAVKAGLSTIVVNLARRSQSLLDRQVEYLDNLESSEEDPTRLGELFKVDHLATRMRRNAESLLVLAEAEPGRRRGAPVEIGDVLRVAMGEVESYQQVELGEVVDGTVTAGVAVDLAHLVAELMENATQFSPPDATVEVSGALRRATGHYVVSIADGGMGLGDRLDGANELLADPPELGLGMGRSLGFMVIGRLAKRLGAEVTLEPNDGGGTVARVCIPTRLFLDGRGATTSEGPSERADNEDGVERGTGDQATTPTDAPTISSTDSPTDARTAAASKSPAVSSTLEKLLGLDRDTLADADEVEAAPTDWASTSPFGAEDEIDSDPDPSTPEPTSPGDDVDSGSEAGPADLDPEGTDRDSENTTADSGGAEPDGDGSDGDSWVPPEVTPEVPARLAEAVPTGEAFEDGMASLLDESSKRTTRPRGLRDDTATSAGLSKRQRGASNVPIGQGRPVAAPTRNPDEVRSMLSRYREGLKGGKQDAGRGTASDEAASGQETGEATDQATGAVPDKATGGKAGRAGRPSGKTAGKTTGRRAATRKASQEKDEDKR